MPGDTPRDLPNLPDPNESTDRLESVLTGSAFEGARMLSNDTVFGFVVDVGGFALCTIEGGAGNAVA